jgi:osmotically-inducible protein OsmY
MKDDQETEDHVRQELRWDSRINAAEIDVAVEARIVRLSGTVQTFAERQATQATTRRLSGVRDGANDIHLNVPGHLLR